MTFRSRRLLRRFLCTAALAATVAAGSGVAAAAQPTGLGDLAQSTPHARALAVLRQMQQDSVRVDTRHWQAAQRCDRAAMAEYLRQLNELAAQARNVIRNSGLENDTSSNAIEADRIAANIEMRARHAASRQAENCGGATAQEPTGATGATRSQSSAEQLLELQKESIRLNSLHYQAAQRCDRAEMERLQALLDALVDQAGEIMRRAAMGPRGARSAVFRDAENQAHNIARRADEARKRQPKNCPEESEQQQNGGAGASNTTGPTPQEVAPPPPPPPPPPAPTPRFNSGSPLDGIRNRAWSAMEEMTDAYEKCDPERFERALGELEQLQREAKAAAAAATGSGEFSTIRPEEARNLAEELQRQVMQRRYLLDGLRRECSKGHRPGGVGTILGPRRPDATDTGPVENEGQQQRQQIEPGAPLLGRVLEQLLSPPPNGVPTPVRDRDFCDDGTAVNAEGECDSGALCVGGAVCVQDNGGRYISADPAQAQTDDHCAPLEESCEPSPECTAAGADPRRCPDEDSPRTTPTRTTLDEIEESERGAEKPQVEDSGQPMEAPEPSTGNTVRPPGPAARPQRNRQGDRCDKPEGERPADCPKR